MLVEVPFSEETCMYGQDHPIESPELIKYKLKEFDAGVEAMIKGKDKKHNALRTAMEKCPQLLTSKFRLKFLRCEIFNTDLALQRFAAYWNKRLEIFGPEKAFQPLTQSKALSEDGAALEHCFLRLVPGVTDPKGRSIVYIDASVQDPSKYKRRSLSHALWYVLHAALENESTQRHGVIFLANPLGSSFSQIDRKLQKYMMPYVLPLRFSALHVCHPPTYVSIVLPVIKLFMSDRMKKRIVLHPGSTEKVLKHLNDCYGLDDNVIPSALGGKVKIDHLGWLADRRSKSL